MQNVTRVARLVAVTTAGVALVIAGIIMMPLPGPGLLVVIAGLWVLSLEYDWARKLRDEARERVRLLREYRKQHRDAPAGSSITPGRPQGPDDPSSFHQAA
jgi:uncharacterized protein (TIGR02611 family)